MGSLKVWLDATDPANLATDENGTAPKDGESIQIWKDLSGNDHHARSVENAPLYNHSAFNSRPTVSFTDDTMAIDGSDQFNWSELTVFTAWKYPESKTWTTLFGRADSPTDVNSPWQFIARRADHSPPRYSFTLNGPSSTSSQFKEIIDFGIKSNNILVLRYDGSSVSAYLNGSKVLDANHTDGMRSSEYKLTLGGVIILVVLHPI